MISRRAECTLYSMRPHIGGLIRFNAILTKVEQHPSKIVLRLEGNVFLLLEVYSKMNSAGLDAFEEKDIPRFISRGYLHTSDYNSIVAIVLHEGKRTMVAFAPHEVVLIENDENEVQEISFPI